MATMKSTLTLTDLSTSTRNTFSSANVGGADRLLRVMLGGVLLADGVHGTGPLGLDAALIVLSVPLIVTAIMAWDPLYALFKVRTATLRAHPVSPWRVRALNANGGINVGTVDRLYRMGLAAVLIATPFMATPYVGVAAVAGTLASIVVMMTVVTGWDPFYQALKLRTATLPIETAPAISFTVPADRLVLIDEVEGAEEDVMQKAA